MSPQPLRRRPLVGIGVIICLGTYAGLLGQPHLTRSVLVAAGLLWLASAGLGLLRPIWRPLMIWSGLLLWAGLYAALFAPPIHPPLLVLDSATSQPVTLQGVSSSDPLLIARSRNQPPICWFDLQVERFGTDLASDPLLPPVPITVFLSMPDRPTTASAYPNYGDQIRITGTLKQKPAPTGHLRLELRADDSAATRTLIQAGTGNPIAAFCYDQRRRAARQLARGIEKDRQALSVIRSLVLGYRRQINTGLYRVFASTGTLHIFAVSGSHIAILSLFATALARSLRLPRPRWIFVWAPLLLFYTVATGMDPSAVRACLMALTLAGAWWINRSGDVFSLTALAAILLILADPAHLTDPGFILSFVLVLGLILVIPPVWETLLARWRHNSELETDPPLFRRFGRWLRKAIAGILVTAGAAWIVSLPLNLYYFKIFSWVSLPGNLITLPIAFLLMLSGGLALLLGAIWPALGVLFNYANWLLARILIASLEKLNALPYGHFKIEGFPIWAVWLYYTLGAGLLCWIYHRRGERAEELETGPRL